MVNWKDPAVVASIGAASRSVTYAFSGLYLWEFVISLDFDIRFFTRKRPFRWFTLPYFYSRYVYLANILTLLAAMSLSHPSETPTLSCVPLVTALKITGNTAVVTCTISLALRTIALWNKKPIVLYPLTALIIGQLVLLSWECNNFSVGWISNLGCAGAQKDPYLRAAVYAYTMGIDLIVLGLTLSRLVFHLSVPAGKIRNESPLTRILFQDGLIYFIVVFLGNTVATVLNLLQLSVTMATIADVPANVFAIVAACRCVRRLDKHLANDEDVVVSDETFVMHRMSSPTDEIVIVVPASRRQSEAGSLSDECDRSEIHGMPTFKTREDEGEIDEMKGHRDVQDLRSD